MIRILLLGLVLAGVWYLYKMVTQQNAAGAPPAPPADDQKPVEPPQAEEPAPEPAAEAPSEQASALEREAADAQEMMECPVCQAYVPETAHDGCGRPDCPIPALAAARDGPG